MQERAATVLAAFFLVILLIAGSVYVAAAPPTVTVEDPDFALSPGDEFEVGDRTYNVTEVEDETATATWIEVDAFLGETWEHESTVEIDEVSYSVMTDVNATPSTLALEEIQELPEDAEVVEVNETEYVVVSENDEQSLVPVDEYLVQQQGEPAQFTYTEGDQFAYQDQTVTVEEIEEESALVTWTGDLSGEESFEHRSQTTIGSDDDEITVVAHIEGDTVYLTEDIESYEAQWDAVDRFYERMQGVFGVGLISAIAAGMILVLSFNPVRRT